jgi:hypothetical protein
MRNENLSTAFSKKLSYTQNYTKVPYRERSCAIGTDGGVPQTAESHTGMTTLTLTVRHFANALNDASID